MRAILLLLTLCATVLGAQRTPNVVLILADDLGYGELGCYGQERIRTPHLDRLAAEGMRFTQAYSGHTVCAPSRCVLLTGLHTGHAQVRGNSPWASRLTATGEGQEPLRFGTLTIPRLLQGAGYRTGAFGKWGLGAPGDEGRPLAQGLDHFTGYLCQKQAHDHYPAHLWRDGARLELANPGYTPSARWDEVPAGDDPYARFTGTDYAEDVMLGDALTFLGTAVEEERPFFLYFPTPIPHAALQVPEDSLAEYLDEGWDAGPYLGTKGYLPHRAPRAAYAAMITRMDRDIGILLDRIDALGQSENTLVLFTSDNGATFNGGVDRAFFESNGNLRGMKTTLYEGGIRVPWIVRWPGHVPAGTECSHPVGFQDVLPTLAEAARLPVPDGLDGTSLLPVLEDPATPLPLRPLYFESGKKQAVRRGRWKLHRSLAAKQPKLELYDLVDDPEESRDLHVERPDLVEELQAVLEDCHEPSPRFPFPGDPPGLDARAPGPWEVSQQVVTLEEGPDGPLRGRLYQPSAAREESRPLVLFLHGWLGSASDYDRLCTHLASHGFVVLSNDTQRGFLASPLVQGRQTFALAQFVVDGSGLLNSPVPEEGWGVVGHSMGGVAAIQLASRHERLGPVCALQPGWPTLTSQTERAAGRIEGPLLVLTGSSDRTCPPHRSRPFAEAGPPGARRLWATVPDLGHLGPIDTPWRQGKLDPVEAHALHREIVLDFLLAELGGDPLADERLVRSRGTWRVGRPQGQLR